MIVISGWSTVNTYHVTKSMGTSSDQLRNSSGSNNTMGCLKGTSPFTSKILKSILFTVCHTSVMKISLRIWCSIKWYPLVWWFSFFSSHCCSVDCELVLLWEIRKIDQWSEMFMVYLQSFFSFFTIYNFSVWTVLRGLQGKN